MTHQILRFDAGAMISSPVTDKDGYLRVDATVCVPGVLSYMRPDGSVIKEFRPSEEHHKLVDTINARTSDLPATIEHPSINGSAVLLDSANVNQFMKGVAKNPRVDEKGYFNQSLVYYDKNAQEAIRHGGKREVSLGYRCDALEEPGTWKGEKYDRVQVNIQPNHVAATAKARAGRDAKIYLDSSVIQVDDVAMMIDPYRFDENTYRTYKNKTSRRYFDMGRMGRTGFVHRADEGGMEAKRTPYTVTRGDSSVTYYLDSEAISLLNEMQEKLSQSEARLDSAIGALTEAKNQVAELAEQKEELAEDCHYYQTIANNSRLLVDALNEICEEGGAISGVSLNENGIFDVYREDARPRPVDEYEEEYEEDEEEYEEEADEEEYYDEEEDDDYYDSYAAEESALGDLPVNEDIINLVIDRADEFGMGDILRTKYYSEEEHYDGAGNVYYAEPPQTVSELYGDFARLCEYVLQDEVEDWESFRVDNDLSNGEIIDYFYEIYEDVFDIKDQERADTGADFLDFIVAETARQQQQSSSNGWYEQNGITSPHLTRQDSNGTPAYMSSAQRIMANHQTSNVDQYL